jgi:sodium transport system permease protein
MNLHPIGIVYFKEARDLLRDRRILISMIAVPLLIMPALIVTAGYVSTKMIGKARQETPKVMLLGGADSPETTKALRALKTFQFVPVSADFTNLISEKKIGAAVEIPAGFDAALAAGRKTEIHIYGYEGELRSTIAASALEQFFRRRRDDLIQRGLSERHLPETVLTPFAIERTNVASPRKVTGNIVGMILPYMVILMCLTGALYPAIDLTAGEKERGTLETLLSSPVWRRHLVLGKVMIVLTVSLVTGFLAVASNGLGLMILKWISADTAKAVPALPVALDPLALAAVCVVMVPVAAFLSSVLIAAGLFARSTKEANSYLQPLLIFVLIPAIAGAMPGMEINFRLALIPILNVNLICREILAGTWHWNYIALVFGSTCLYAALAVTVAIALFQREEVLFRS